MGRMTTFNWIAAAIVILSLIYIGFLQTIAGWINLLRKGQTVTLLPEREGHRWPLWTQITVVIVLFLIFILLLYLGWVPLFTLAYTTARVLGISGLLLYMAGFVFVLWARRTLDRYWGISRDRQVKLFDDHQLIQSGPYAFVRHPMYSGWLVAMLGLTLLYPVWSVFLWFLLLLISFFNRARREEAALAERFGETWVEYKMRTKFLIPFIY